MTETPVQTLFILPDAQAMPSEDYARCEELASRKPLSAKIAHFGDRVGVHLSPRFAVNEARTTQAGRVLVADLRCGPALIALREAGFHAQRIGLRCFGADPAPDGADAASGLTLLEEIAAVCGTKLEDAEQWREAWSRDGWAGLSALGINWSEALALVERDRGIRHPRELTADARRIVADHDDLILALARAEDPDGLVDALQWPMAPRDAAKSLYLPDPWPGEYDPRVYAEASAACRPVLLKPALVLHQSAAANGPADIERLVFTTGMGLRHWLHARLGDPRITRDFDLRLEVGRWRCRLIAQRRRGAPATAMDTLVSRILGVALVTGRPLRHYDGTFLLPLDLHTEQDLEGKGGYSPPKGLLVELEGALEERTKAGILERVPYDDAGNAAARIASAVESAKMTPLRQRRIADGASGAELADAQALVYMLPDVQHRVFVRETSSAAGAGDERAVAESIRLRHWRLPAGRLAGMRLEVTDERTLVGGTCDEIQTVAPLRELALFRYDQGLYLLGIRAALPERSDDEYARSSPPWSDGEDWWHRLLDADPMERAALQQTQAEHWLWFTKAARLLRSAFPEQRIERKIGHVRLLAPDGQGLAAFEDGDRFNPIVLECLALLTGLDLRRRDDGDERLRFVRDDRMIVNCAYGLAGPPPGDDPEARTALRRLFSLALFVDRGTDGWASEQGFPYDRRFTEQALDEGVIRRWEGLGTLIGCTNYSQAAVGCGPTFCGPIARIHLPQIYGRLLVLTSFFELTLAHFGRRIACETARAGQASSRKRHLETLRRVEGLHEDFVRFTNRTWLREATAQVQGRELFDLQSRAFGLAEQYALIKDRIERTDELLQVRQARLNSNRAELLAKGAVVFAIVAPLIAAIQLARDPVIVDAEPTTGFSGLVAWLWSMVLDNAWFTISLLIVLFAAFRFRHLWRQQDRDDRE